MSEVVKAREIEVGPVVVSTKAKELRVYLGINVAGTAVMSSLNKQSVVNSGYGATIIPILVRIPEPKFEPEVVIDLTEKR